MGTKYVRLSERLYGYLCACRSDASDPLLKELRAETAALGREVSKCQISDEQGTFLSVLVTATGVKSAIEVGTFTGYSSICIARALPTQGRLLCLDASAEWTAVARKYWARAGLEDRIELRLGAALTQLKKLERGLRFDFAFIDADKTGYDAYYELVLPHIRRNGLILFDNMLWGGRLGKGPVKVPAGRAIDALNRKLARDPRVEAVLLPVADGIQLCRKR
jgi:caffeoyl-CoA O-methyltransferase